MKADYLSYKTAAGRSVLGLVIQFVLGVVLLLYGLYARGRSAADPSIIAPADHAAITAAFLSFIGMIVWFALAVVFDQHRRERIEAVEAEAFAASDAATSSVFEREAQDHRVAAKRLANMYRYFLPVVSLLVGALLVLVGVWRYRVGLPYVHPETPTEPRLRGWAIALGLGAAFVGFLFARYASGMAKQKIWANLRAGARYAVGIALLGLAMVIGQFVDIAGPDVLLRYFNIAFPVVLVVLGAEVFLNFVLDLYRPRKQGEYPRPAFDSRILGFAAAPDRIAQSIGEALNYQFGYDVTDSWVYRLLSRSALMLVGLAALVLWGMSSLVVIGPHERGLVMRFGRYVETLGPGLHFKAPWPIDRVQVPAYTRRDAKGVIEHVGRTVTGVRTLSLGSTPSSATGPILWTNEHAIQEMQYLVHPTVQIPSRPSPATGPSEERPEAPGERDLAIVAVEVPLHYAVRDVRAFEELAPPDRRDELLRAVAQRELFQYISTLTVEDVLTGRRQEMAAELRRRIEAAYTRINPLQDGTPVVDVLFVGVEGVHPPKDTAMQFEQVNTAQQRRAARIDTARADAIKTLTAVAGSVGLAEQIVEELTTLRAMAQAEGATPESVAEQRVRVRGLIERAGGEAAKIILEAAADRWRKVNSERARLAAYQGQVGSYKAAPEIYRATLFLEALKSVMADARVFIIDAGTKYRIRFDGQDKDTSVDAFTKSSVEEQ